MTRLWKTSGFVRDIYVELDDTQAAPADVPVSVSLARWRTESASLKANNALVAVRIEPTSDLSQETDTVAFASCIIVPFAKFSDGRGYSLARRLRDNFGFRGELRASGDVLLDQLPLMLRCGFDTFAISHAPTVAALEAGHLPAIPEVYQRAVFGRARTTAAFQIRHLLLAAE